MAFQDMIGFKVKVFITQHKNAYLEMIYHSVGLYTFFFFLHYYKNDRTISSVCDLAKEKVFVTNVPIYSTRTLGKMPRSFYLNVF